MATRAASFAPHRKEYRDGVRGRGGASPPIDVSSQSLRSMMTKLHPPSSCTRHTWRDPAPCAEADGRHCDDDLEYGDRRISFVRLSKRQALRRARTTDLSASGSRPVVMRRTPVALFRLGSGPLVFSGTRVPVWLCRAAFQADGRSYCQRWRRDPTAAMHAARLSAAPIPAYESAKPIRNLRLPTYDG